MKILISGVSSFLGIYTAKELLSQGHQVYGIVRKESKNREKLESLRGLQLISVDMKAFSSYAEEGKLALAEGIRKQEDSFSREAAFSRNGFALASLLPKDVDAIIHFAWDGVGSKGRENPEIQEQNLLMSKGFYQWGLQTSVKYFLFAGSQAEYGRGTREHPEPVSAYGKAKLSFSLYGLSGGKGEESYSFQEEPKTVDSLEKTTQGKNPENSEEEGRKGKMDFLDLRIFSVYGIGDHESTLVQTLVQAVLAGQSMDLSPCSQMWNFMEARDLARAISFLLEGDFGSGTYDLCGKESRPLKDFVLEIEALGKAFLEKKEGKKALATSLLRFGERASNAEGPVDLKPSVKDLYDRGFQEKISFSQGIEELYQYFYQKKEGEAWQRKDV
ncbi:NAD-dependent epimerase/dehydratase family protein [Oribacterium sinus]|uniref:NAD(P)-dependent oxidoreductase n=1 Tax=Oribacterium sinus TaxID=237576 RepID=A0A930DQC9_9FIRM|nr:NAD(P)-dependent oxidoreductase [Oribacterium sinus]MBF1273624.1 NAD(P)-dependent oxidoreductase [Oribacterium sinus]